MSPDEAQSDPLHEYEEHALPPDGDRARRLMELKRAIRAGTYDERQILDRLLNNFSDGITKQDTPTSDDDPS